MSFEEFFDYFKIKRGEERRQAYILMGHILDLPPEQIFLNRPNFTESHLSTFKDLFSRLRRGEPITRILGKREFFGLEFTLNEGTLDPRPDSETLIEAVLREYKDQEASLKCLDLGMGSGCLLLTFLHLYRNASGVGADVSEKALEATQKNASSLDLSARAELIQSHWFSELPKEECFDIILSNPPYISRAEMAELDDNVRLYDPELALFGGEDGLDCYREIAKDILAFLRPKGNVFLEIGWRQKEDVIRIFEGAGLKREKEYTDLEGRDRVLVFKR